MDKIKEKLRALTPEQKGELSVIRSRRIAAVITVCCIVTVICYISFYLIMSQGDRLRFGAERYFDFDYEKYRDEREKAEVFYRIAVGILYAWLPTVAAGIALTFLAFKKKYPFYSGKLCRCVKRQDKE